MSRDDDRDDNSAKAAVLADVPSGPLLYLAAVKQLGYITEDLDDKGRAKVADALALAQTYAMLALVAAIMDGRRRGTGDDIGESTWEDVLR